MSFLGPKPNQDPMNNVFEQKNSWGKNFRDPRDPRPKKFSGPARAGGGPKVVQIVPLGSLTLLKRSGALKNNGFEYKYYVELFFLAKVMTKTRFFGLPWGFWPVLGASRPHGPHVLA